MASGGFRLEWMLLLHPGERRRGMAYDNRMERRQRHRRCCAVCLSDGSVAVAKVADSPLSRLRGLIGRKPSQALLLITRCHDVHTFCMSAPIDLAFLDGDGRVVKVARAVAPGNRVFASALAHDGGAAVIERFSQAGPWVKTGDYPLKSAVSLAYRASPSACSCSEID